MYLCFVSDVTKRYEGKTSIGIWLGFIALKRDDLDYSVKEYTKNNIENFDEYRKNMTKIEIDDYVVNDYHVNKGFGLGKFASEGAKVVDEDLSLLGDKGEEYKRYYIEMKQKSDPKSKKKKVPKNTIEVSKETEPFIGLEKLSFNEFTEVKILEEGVCGGKVPCIDLIYKGKRYILKQMGESMNYGKDYIFMDECKSIFDLWV